MAYGVRKVNEYIVRDGRALIMTQNVSSGITKEQWDSVGNGTLYLSPDNGDITYKARDSAPRVWSRFKPGNLFIDQDITGNFIKDKTLINAKLADNSINTRTIIDRNVTSVKLATGLLKDEHFVANTINGQMILNASLDGAKLKDSSLNGLKLIDRTVDGIKLKLSTITSLELASNSVITDKILNLNVTEAKLAANSVTRDKIKDLEVLTAKLADASVTNPKLAEKSVNWINMMDNSIKTTHITDLNVTDVKLADNSVLTRTIKDSNVTLSKLASDSVNTSKIVNKSVTLAKLEDSVQSIIRNAVVHNGDSATVNGNLIVKGNIMADPNTLTRTITGFKVYNPLFADYAEGFVPAEPLQEGHIVEIDKEGCVKKAGERSKKIVGIVSERYGMCLDASPKEIASGEKVAVGLIGKVPVKIVGVVEAGDFIYSCGDGIGIATKKVCSGTIVGKALEDKTTHGIGTVLCLIQNM